MNLWFIERYIRRSQFGRTRQFAVGKVKNKWPKYLTLYFKSAPLQLTQRIYWGKWNAKSLKMGFGMKLVKVRDRGQPIKKRVWWSHGYRYLEKGCVKSRYWSYQAKKMGRELMTSREMRFGKEMESWIDKTGSWIHGDGD